MLSFKHCFAAAFFLHTSLYAFSQDTSVQIPTFNDKYSSYIKQLEAGQVDIDYADFRNSFLESKQYNNKSGNYSNLKKQVYAAIKNKNYNEVIKLTKAMISIDYTSMFAHHFLQQTYQVLQDTVNRNKYHHIEFGLLNSIIDSGDGITCETGWHVTQIEEEYFVLDMMGAQFQSQATGKSKNNQCDVMTVKTEKGEIKTYYFEANKVFEMEKKMFGF
jgi:hypothetical protein